MVVQEAVGKIIIGADHAGVQLKSHLIETVLGGLDVVDVGVESEASVDYPDIAHRAVDAMEEAGAERAILICGTGIGMAMAAGHRDGVRAAVCTDAFTAEMSRRHNDANVLCLGARVIGSGVAEQIVRLWLETPFEGGRHERRVGKIEFGPHSERSLEP